MSSDELKGIIEECCDGNRKSQYKLYKYLAPKLLSSCYRYVNSKVEAEDIVQEAFIKIFGNIGNFRFDSKIETWAIRIMINTMLTKQKLTEKYKANVSLESATEIAQDIHISNSHSHDELLSLLHSLPELYKNIFNLYEIEGYEHKEIAEMLQINESTCRVYLTRAKSMLQEKHKKLNEIRREKEIS